MKEKLLEQIVFVITALSFIVYLASLIQIYKRINNFLNGFTKDVMNFGLAAIAIELLIRIFDVLTYQVIEFKNWQKIRDLVFGITTDFQELLFFIFMFKMNEVQIII